MKNKIKEDSQKTCHVCMNVQTSLTLKADFVNISGWSIMSHHRQMVSTVYPIMSLCDACLVDYNNMMPYFASWSVKPANHPSYY